MGKRESVFIDSWQVLSKKAQKSLSLFIRSPYFNKNQVLIEAISFIESYKHSNDASTFKRDLFIHLFKNKKYVDSKIRYILSDLTGLLKKFIVIEFDNRLEIASQLELNSILVDHKMEKLGKREWNKLSQSIELTVKQNPKTHYYKYNYYLEAQEREALRSRRGYAYLPEAVFNLEAHFIAESLRLACLNAGPQSIIDLTEIQTLLPNIVEHVEAGKYLKSPAVVIYYYAYQMLYNKDESYYFKLSDWLKENWRLFLLSEIEDIYLLGINFCISKINSGNRDYMKHAFDLYKAGLSNKVFMKDGYLSIYNYKNILRLGLTQKAYEWTESFLYEFKKWLPKEEQENTFNYNLAYFYFHKKDYDSCMDLLRTVKFKDVYNNLDSRRMLLRIYYELEEWSALDSHLDSFQSYAIRQKSIGYHKVANLNLVKITRLMMKKFPLSGKSKLQVEKRIQNATHLAEQDWVIKTAGL